MPLTPGTRLGVYEITGLLGEGGMGQVYRARDTRLDRDVAIKILPGTVAGDSDRVARFEREARTLASLSHPHIAHVYGLEDSSGVRAIVMELVEGEDLSALISSGPIPERDAIAFAKQIVDALEGAHEAGIVHRDLKPANIKVRSDGTVKVLDFGLAKAVDAGSAGGNLANSPTITNPAALTAAGIVLGTAAYMSPEQAKGRVTDKRTDVWAFGCILYEMLAGRRAFQGEDVSDTLAAVLRGEPDWSALPPGVSANVITVIKRCLERDRKARIPDAFVIRFLLHEPGAAHTVPATPSAIVRRSAWPTRLGLATLALTTLVGLALAWYFYRASTDRPTTRFLVSAPAGTSFVTGGRPATSSAISPDGTKLAFTARDAAGKVQLWVRPVDSFVAAPLPGTDEAMFPFWSPDSRSLGFFNGTKLLRIDVGGGPPQTLGNAENGRGGAWSRDNVIVFGGNSASLSRVPAGGGESTALTTLEADQIDHRFPSFMPDGSQALFYMNQATGGGAVYVAAMATGKVTKLLSSDTSAIYSHGYLLFARSGTLLAQKFDAASLVTAGDPLPVAEQLETGIFSGMLGFSASETGTLTYGTGVATAYVGQNAEVLVVDRQGKTLQTLGAGNYVGVDLSPDGAQVAAHRHEGGGAGTGGGGDLWLLGLQGGAAVRFTFDREENAFPLWSPDGQRIAFFTRRGGKSAISQKPSSGAGDDERLLELPASSIAVLNSWSPDGQTLLYSLNYATAGSEIWRLPLGGDRTPSRLLTMSQRESNATLSPDGKWLAFQSNRAGLPEIYVKPFPSGPGQWQVSTAGARSPRWRGDGKELFFLTGRAGNLASVDVTLTGATPQFGATKPLFSYEGIDATHQGHRAYAVFRDGQRFVISRPREAVSDEPANSPIAVVANWLEGLRR